MPLVPTTGAEVAAILVFPPAEAIACRSEIRSHLAGQSLVEIFPSFRALALVTPNSNLFVLLLITAGHLVTDDKKINSFHFMPPAHIRFNLIVLIKNCGFF